MRFLQAVLTVGILFISIPVSSQTEKDIRHAEDSLMMIAAGIRNAGNDSARLAINKQFEETLYRILIQYDTFGYPFDSLKTLAKLTFPDRKFRIYNWNLPLGNGTNAYFCFIQMNPKGKGKQAVYKLADLSDSISQPETALLDIHSWFGALYYSVIITYTGNKTVYTLLGWDGVNSRLSQKIIEVLSFDKKETPRFGARIFRNFGNDR